jgi:RNA polymerase sigma-70 factor (ECF subfamily)
MFPRMSITPADATGEARALLATAQTGDEEAFRRLLEPHRRELHAHCYRMLGSVHDAEDALQDALLRAWRGLPGFEGRSSLRAWLYRIATNACLNAMERRPARHLPVAYLPASDWDDDEPPLVESVWLEPYPDAQLGLADGRTAPSARYEQRESVELAFVAALQLLPPGQRAVLVMREVLGFSAREVAESLGTTVASVNSALQRARKAIAERLPAQSQQATLRGLGEGELQAIAEGYADAMERGDVAAVVAMLTEDATWSMPPWACWYSGREAITGFLRDNALAQQWRHVVTRANGQLAVGCYSLNAERSAYVFEVLDVLDLRGGHIAAVTGFVTADLYASFGLPAELPLAGPQAP